MIENTNAAIAFVTDLSGSSGVSVEDQHAIRASVHAQLSSQNRACQWIDILSKTDLYDDEAVSPFDKKNPVHRVSVTNRSGLEGLHTAMLALTVPSRENA